MAKYINEELKISIEVPKQYSYIDKTLYKQLGIDEKSEKQTLFIFVNTNSPKGDNFNVTRDAVYKNNQEALTNGVEANIKNIEKQGYYIVSKDKFITIQGTECVKVIALYNNKLYITLMFVAVNGLLMCLGYTNDEQNFEKEMLFENIVSSLKQE